MKSLLYLGILILFLIPSVLSLGVNIPIPINYSAIVSNLTTNSSAYWGSYLWTDYNMPTIKSFAYNQTSIYDNYNATRVDNNPTICRLNQSNDFGANNLITTGTGTFGTQVTTPLIETAAAASTLSIQPDATGTGYSVKFFENAVTGVRPVIGFYGFADAAGTGKRVGQIYVDTWGRLVFSGDVASTMFTSAITAGGDAVGVGRSMLNFPSAGKYSLYYSDANSETVKHLGLKLGYTASSISSVFALTSTTAFNYQVPYVTDPTLMIFSDNSNITQYIKFYHDGTDAHIDVGAGDLKFTAAGGDIDFDNENLKTTGTGTFGNLIAGNITNMSYAIMKEQTGSCNLLLNHSICSNATGTYLVG